MQTATIISLPIKTGKFRNTNALKIKKQQLWSTLHLV